MNPVKELVPFHDGLKYPIDHIILMIISSDDGQIYEVSENLLDFIHLSGMKKVKDLKDFSYSDKNRYLCDFIIDDFNF